MAGQELKKPKGGYRGSSAHQHTGTVLGDDGEQFARRFDSLAGDRRHTVEEKVEPSLPIPFGTDGPQAAVVFASMTLEEETQIEKRLSGYDFLERHVANNVRVASPPPRKFILKTRAQPSVWNSTFNFLP